MLSQENIQFDVWDVLSQGGTLSYGLMVLELQGEIWVQCLANQYVLTIFLKLPNACCVLTLILSKHISPPSYHVLNSH